MEELIRLKTKKTHLKEEISFANKLLFKYANRNTSSEEEYKEGSTICNALKCYVADMKQNVLALNVQIESIERNEK